MRDPGRCVMVAYGELVFPRYGKAEGGPVFPGEQRAFAERVTN